MGGLKVATEALVTNEKVYIIKHYLLVVYNASHSEVESYLKTSGFAVS